MANYCIDCGAEISDQGTRCRSCTNKWRWEHGTYDNNRRSSPNYCLDCGVEICDEATRCPSCARKYCWMRGDFDNQRSPPNYCVDCGVEIGIHSIRCVSCNNRWRWRFGDLGSEVCRHKRSEAIKAAYRRGAYDGVFDEEWRCRLSEAMKAARARGCYDGVFQSPTGIELQVAAALDIFGIEHIPQYRPENCRWSFDEFVPPKTLIEVQGDYWHGPKRPEQQRRDVEKAQWAKENDYELIEIWEHDIEEQGAWALVAQEFREEQ